MFSLNHLFSSIRCDYFWHLLLESSELETNPQHGGVCRLMNSIFFYFDVSSYLTVSGGSSNISAVDDIVPQVQPGDLVTAHQPQQDLAVGLGLPMWRPLAPTC